MSLDNRLREGLHQLAADFPPQPLDIGSDLQGVLVAGHRRRVLRQAYLGIAAIAIVAIAVLAAPNLFRQLGIQQVDTAGKPPTELGRDDGLGTGGGSGTNNVTTGGGGRSVGGSQQSSGNVPPTRQSSGGHKAAVTKPSTPNRAGTYSFSTEGSEGEYFAHGRRTMKELLKTFDQPTGSHQRWREKVTYEEGSRRETEYGFDFRPDGVYWEHYAGTLYNAQGAVTYAEACPEIEAVPLRFWPTGTKPGDHLEYELRCAGGSRRITRDILRSETVSVGGREVETLYVQGGTRGEYAGLSYSAFHEEWILPDHVFGVKGHSAWSYSCWGCGSSEYWTMLDSMTPS